VSCRNGSQAPEHSTALKHVGVTRNLLAGGIVVLLMCMHVKEHVHACKAYAQRSAALCSRTLR
jgi:hypothetical protein